MKNLVATKDFLANDFSILDLGSADATLLSGLRPFAPCITLVEIDAVSATTNTNAQYFRHVSIKGAVSGKAEKRIFHERAFSQCSSFLDANMELVKAYGLETFFQEKAAHEFECQTLASVLAAAGISRLDWLKTDLEGLDYEVLLSAPALVKQTLVIQSELRFQPIYRDEPAFHVTAQYLGDLGFEIVALRPETWKYATRQRDHARDGRTVWADTIFFLSAAQVQHQFGPHAPRALAKQILLANALGLSNFAEYLLQSQQAAFPSAVYAELDAYVSQSSWVSRLINEFAKIKGGHWALFKARGLSLRLARLASLQPFRHIAPNF